MVVTLAEYLLQLAQLKPYMPKNGIFPHSSCNALGGRLKPKQIILLDSAVQSWTKLP
jgi:hypothetical protein